MSNRPTRIERQAYRWVLKMLDDPGRHSAALERWLAKDDEHRAVYKRVAIEVGRASDSAALMPSLRSASSASEHSRRVSRRRAIALGGMAVAGAAVIAIVGAPHLMPGDISGNHAPTVEERVYAATASNRIVQLADTSEVTIFAGSRLATRFTAGERSVDLLGGSARFAVAHDPSRPFVVYAGGGKVTATGTLFEVAITDGVKVRLISGKVEVKLPDVGKQGVARVIHLDPGQQVTYLPMRTLSSGPAAQPLLPPPTQRMESFDDVPAADIAERVNRTSAVKIVFDDPRQGAREVFAELDLSNADAVAQRLAKVLGLVVDRSKAGRLLLRHPS